MNGERAKLTIHNSQLTIQNMKNNTGAPNDLDKDNYKIKTIELVNEISDLATALYAERQHSILVLLQGMDGSGKDGTTKNVFGSISPSFVRFHAFKKPTEEEMAHDFLWRAHKMVPKRGEITIFNRSYYEDILIQYVHGWIDDKKRDIRMDSINAFEKLLEADNNTTILKFFLNISFEKQEEKLMERVTIKKKQWKHSDGDWEERKLWDKYQSAYKYAMDNSKIKWINVPCDNEWFRNYVVAKEVHKALSEINPKYPEIKTELFKTKNKN